MYEREKRFDLFISLTAVGNKRLHTYMRHIEGKMSMERLRGVTENFEADNVTRSEIIHLRYCELGFFLSARQERVTRLCT